MLISTRDRCSQADTEKADLARETRDVATDVEAEEELARICYPRRVDAELARLITQQLMPRDALAAHGRNSFGNSDDAHSAPMQAALASAATFSVGAAAPLALVMLSPPNAELPASGCILRYAGVPPIRL